MVEKSEVGVGLVDMRGECWLSAEGWKYVKEDKREKLSVWAGFQVVAQIRSKNGNVLPSSEKEEGLRINVAHRRKHPYFLKDFILKRAFSMLLYGAKI